MNTADAAPDDTVRLPRPAKAPPPATGQPDPEHPVLHREQTLAIVFGASEWPFYPDFQDAPSFRHSAHEMADYLRSPAGLNLPARNVKVLVDAFDPAPEILEQMWDFIRTHRAALAKDGTPATDLLLYYVGHGGFSDSDAFFLSTRSTNEDDPLATSITAESLGRLVREAASGLRTYVVLDCCFAASASKEFMSAGPVGVAGAQLAEVLPPQGDSAAAQGGQLPAYGTALLCASGPREPAKAPADLPFTMFTGGLLEVLRQGDPSAPAWLSLDDMQRLVRARLEARFGDKAVLPQVHAPQQRKGRVDLVPLFHNPARGAPSLEIPYSAGASERPAAAMQPEPSPPRLASPAVVVPSPGVAALSLGVAASSPGVAAPSPGVAASSPATGVEPAAAGAAQPGPASAASVASARRRSVWLIGIVLVAIVGGLVWGWVARMPSAQRAITATTSKAVAEQAEPATGQATSAAAGPTAPPATKPASVTRQIAPITQSPAPSTANPSTPMPSDAYTEAVALENARQFTAAAAAYQRLAEAGNAAAQYRLGELYENGRGVHQSYPDAARLFQLSADQGNQYAQAHLGSFYMHGLGVQQSDAKAAQLFKLAADQGDAGAENSLGYLYQNGRGVAQSYTAAARLFQLAADQGNAAAQASLASLYLRGLGVQPSFAEAARLGKLAADQGNAGAENSLGNLYEAGRGVPQSYPEAAKYFQLAADQGNAAAATSLGNLYASGSGVTQSDADAARYYKTAADAGDANAQASLALFYLNGHSVPQSDTEAVRLLRLAAGQGNSVAQANLAYLYLSDRGVDRSDTEAARLLQLATDGGNWDAENALALLYEAGRGVAQSDVEAARLLKLAAAVGNPSAQNNLGLLYERATA